MFRKVLVTGGAGFIGHRLCSALLDAGSTLVCLDDLSTGSPENAADLAVRGGCSYVHHDVIDPFPDIGPVDLVVHLACPPSPSYYVEHPIATMRCTADGTRHALEAALRSGARFLLASTSEVYGDPAEHPQSEAYWGNVNPIGPRSVYDEGKRYAEALTMAYVREHRVNAVIARIFNTYGPRMRVDDGRMIPTFITQALNDEPLPVYGTGQQTRSLCHVDDTVAGLLALATSTERDPGPVNIGNPEEVTVNHVARTIARLIRDADPRIDYRPALEDDPVRRRPDITRARTRLDWRPMIGLEDGLRQTINWFTGAAAPSTPNLLR